MHTHRHMPEKVKTQVEIHVTVEGKSSVQLLVEALKLQASPRKAKLCNKLTQV